MKKELKSFWCFVTVWHKRGEPYNVSSYMYYAVAVSEDAVKKMIDAEVKTYKYWKHGIGNIEEIKLDEKHLRRVSSQPYDSAIIKEAVENSLQLEKKRHSKLRARCGQEKLTCCFIKLDKLLSGFPAHMYDLLAKNLKPGSKIVIDDGIFYIYNGRKKEETFRETELDMLKEKLVNQMRKILKDTDERIIDIR